MANNTVLLARGGGEHHISDTAAPIRDAAGQIVGVVLVFSDVTATYRARQALITTTEMLERTSAMAMARVGGGVHSFSVQYVTVREASDGAGADS